MSESPFVVELDGVGHAYGRDVVLDGVALRVRRGEIAGVFGPSGAGKSTLLRIAAGLERPKRGTVCALDRALWTPTARKPALPYAGWAAAVFQNPSGSLDPAWSVKRLLEEPFRTRRFRSVTRSEQAHRIDTVLTKVGLGDIALAARPAQLSGGQQQRVALARSYLAEPALLVADEPTSALDVTNGASVMHLLRDLASRNTAVLVVSHDEAMLASLADTMYVCTGGALHLAAR